MKDWLDDLFQGRPWWMNALMVFCGYMTFVYIPWDLFVKPAANDAEVWFGIMFTGAAAKVMAVPHWLVYGAATYGFRRMRPWMPAAGALYAAQIAIGMFVWNVAQLGGLTGWLVGFAGALPFSWLALAFWGADEHFARPRPNLRERYGEWGVVTGASAGIGEEFARALARDGMSCVLVARRQDKLRELADELDKNFQVQTRVVAADLSSPEGCDVVLDALADIEVSVLVNNAGIGYAGRFDKQDPERIRALVQLNCVTPAVLANRLLPGMRERGRGALVITGSVAGQLPLPLHAVYSASKAFDNFLGEALFIEMRGSGVDVVVLEPGSTETEFQQVAGEIAHAGESPAQVVRVALDALGKQPSVVSGWFNYLRGMLARRVLPRPLQLYVARDVISEQTSEEMR